jgi:hypothetical protein
VFALVFSLYIFFGSLQQSLLIQKRKEKQHEGDYTRDIYIDKERILIKMD